MAGPLAGISAAQVAQQKLPEQAAQQGPKGGPSKFDQVQATKSSGVEGANVDQVHGGKHVNAAHRVQEVQKTHRLDQVGKVDRAALAKVTDKAADPVALKQEITRSTSMLNSVVENIEKGQVTLDRLINGGLTGKQFNNTELLALQAGMYKYSQELDLCSKVVEKATSGLKDTLKTQV